MLFNSIDFAIFLPLVFALYWGIANKHVKVRNAFLLLISYLFYGWWDWRFLSLIAFSSCVDYLLGLQIHAAQHDRSRRWYLTISLATNLGLLGFFKYYDFFVDSFINAFTIFGQPLSLGSLYIILPVGISFYTFQTLSYTIDIYRRKLVPTNDPIAFFAFVSFFPQLVAGPIERATNLLPQFKSVHTFNYAMASEGIKKMLWGFVLKIAIADRLALYVDSIYSHLELHTGISYLVATFFFSIQIYCDFAGYSLIAIGCAQLFGFRLTQNFNRPYLATSFGSLWNRWHISLSTWFRDYIYIPLGGNRNGLVKMSFYILVTFILSGLWHGANWTFIIWGAIHGLYLIIEKNTNIGKLTTNKTIKTLVVYTCTLFAWVFFRAANLGDAMLIIRKIVLEPGTELHVGDIGIFAYGLLAIFLLFIVEWVTEHRPKVQLLRHHLSAVRMATMVFLVVYILAMGVFDESQFIYFQF